MCVNRLILGDNLEILKTVGSETVDLIYLDPPFFSNGQSCNAKIPSRDSSPVETVKAYNIPHAVR